jgi:hypothetical protein
VQKKSLEEFSELTKLITMVQKKEAQSGDFMKNNILHIWNIEGDQWLINELMFATD